MQHANALPTKTLALLQKLAEGNDTKGFTLIGGTALALHHGHRMSEDIDLAWPDQKLPRKKIQTILDRLSPDEPAMDIMDPLGKQLAENDGVDLDDYHQDWLVKGVKLTFFAPDGAEQNLARQGQKSKFANLEIASEEAIFKMKARLILKRQMSRDYFDLWYLTERKGKKIGDILREMRQTDPHRSVDAHLLLISSPVFKAADPLWETTLPGAPQTPDELISKLGVAVDAHRLQIAHDAAAQAQRQRTQGR